MAQETDSSSEVESSGNGTSDPGLHGGSSTRESDSGGSHGGPSGKY